MKRLRMYDRYALKLSRSTSGATDPEAAVEMNIPVDDCRGR